MNVTRTEAAVRVKEYIQDAAANRMISIAVPAVDTAD
jgi:hypothetical protein